ncbi:MAG: hypothetical protein JXK05_07510 [Campylobacterales bacterium]|nr:hypothetical protein [Campylobacterales bacterium]
MKTLCTALMAALLLIGCGNDDTEAKTETTLQPQVQNAAIRPPAPPVLEQ